MPWEHVLRVVSPAPAPESKSHSESKQPAPPPLPPPPLQFVPSDAAQPQPQPPSPRAAAPGEHKMAGPSRPATPRAAQSEQRRMLRAPDSSVKQSSFFTSAQLHDGNVRTRARSLCPLRALSLRRRSLPRSTRAGASGGPSPRPRATPSPPPLTRPRPRPRPSRPRGAFCSRAPTRCTTRSSESQHKRREVYSQRASMLRSGGGRRDRACPRRPQPRCTIPG